VRREASFGYRGAVATDTTTPEPPTVRYAILGPVEIRDGAGAVPAGGPRQLALLVLLLLNANETVSSDRLIDALWSDNAAGADKRLQMAVARLRKVLDTDAPALHTSAGGYALHVAPGELDADVFKALIADGRSALEAGDAERALAVLTQALGLWRGAPLADVSYMEFAQPEIRRLQELRLEAIEARVDAELKLLRHAALVGQLEALSAEEPMRERIAAQLMLALYRCGRQGEALAVYRRIREHLSNELGIEPGRALQALHAEILDQSPALDPPLTPPAHVPAPIPALVARLGAKQLIGRGDVLARLTQIWGEVVAEGAHRIVLLAGEPGVGKTSLATRLACDAGAEGATILYGRADPEALIPYQPFVEALRHLVLHVQLATLESTSADLVELSRLVPELCRRLPDLGSPVDMTGGDERYKLFSAAAALLVDAAARAPVLIVLDDLHWADASSLRLLSHLARYSDPARLLILGTYRDTDLPHAPQLADTLVDLNREHLDERILLSGLDEQAVGELIATATKAAPADLTPLLLRETRGNPFFLVEMLRHLADSDALIEVERRGAAPLLERIGVPDGVRQLVERRLARLGAITSEALMLASVLGQKFDLGALAAVAARPTNDLTEAMDEALDAGLLSEAAGPPGTFEFSHALVRETLYRRPSAVRREILHGRAGDALVELYGGRDHAHAAELARHFLAAGARGDNERAVRYSVIAARQALSRLAYEEAAGLFTHALERAGGNGGALDETEQRRRYELLIALGEARWCAGDLGSAREAYLQAADAADALGDPECLGRAALGYAGPLRFEPAARREQPLGELLSRAIDGLGTAPGAMRARLQARLAAVLLSGGDDARKHELASDAIALARAAGDRAALAEVLSTCLFATRSPDNLEWRIKTGRELERLADELGDTALQAVTHGGLLDDTLEAGDIDASHREREVFERLADKLGERYRRWLVIVAKGRAALIEGRLDESEALALQASTLGLGGDDESAFHALGVQLLAVRREQARLEELLPGAEAFAAQYPEIPAWRCGLAYVYAEIGRKADASRELDALGADRFAALKRDAWWLLGTSMLSEVAAFVEHPEHVPVLYEQLEPYADRCIVITTTCNGSASRVLGLLATALGRFDAAERHFEDALALNERIRSPLWVGHTRGDYASMLLRRGGAGDAERARTLLDQALGTASELGLHAVARKAESLIR
jgi:DNA-binding SARP family transcriptional activator/tetratricopeptide (TPR) repeat protein